MRLDLSIPADEAAASRPQAGPAKQFARRSKAPEVAPAEAPVEAPPERTAPEPKSAPVAGPTAKPEPAKQAQKADTPHDGQNNDIKE